MRMRMSTQILPRDGCRRAFSGGKKASFYKGAGHRWIIPRKASVSEEASEQFRDPGQDQFRGTGKPGLEGHCSRVPHGLEGGAEVLLQRRFAIDGHDFRGSLANDAGSDLIRWYQTALTAA